MWRRRLAVQYCSTGWAGQNNSRLLHLRSGSVTAYPENYYLNQQRIEVH